MTTVFHDRLNSWFGDVPYDILQEYTYAVDGTPTMFATVRTRKEVLAIRVRRLGGKIKVSADQRVIL